VELRIARPVCLSAHTGDEAWRWHARFGHVNFISLKKMASAKIVHGLPELDHVEQLCEACLAGKHRCAPFPSQATRRATRSLQLLHGDLCGPITPTTPTGSMYFLLLVDDHNRYMWLSLLPSKGLAVDAIKKIKAAAEKKSGHELCGLRTDKGGEFTAAQFTEYCAELGIRREMAAPYSPQQNGVVERRNQTIMAAARCMLKAKNLPRIFLGEDVNCAVYLLNKTSSKSIEGKTSYELWVGNRPSVHHLRIFGCVAYVKVVKPNLRKLEDRSKAMIFVGYEPGSAAYRCYDPHTKRVHISRDVVFDEDASWDWTDNQTEMTNSEFSVEGYPEDFQTTVTETMLREQLPGKHVQTEEAEQDSGGVSVSPVSLRQELSPARTAAIPGSAEPSPSATPPSTNLDADHDEDAPLRYRHLTDILGPGSPPG
jgi:hypothetical protein